MKILGKCYPTGGIIVRSSNSRKNPINNHTSFSEFVSLYSLFLWGVVSGRRGKILVADLRLSVPHPMKDGGPCFNQRRQHQNHQDI